MIPMKYKHLYIAVKITPYNIVFRKQHWMQLSNHPLLSLRFKDLIELPNQINDLVDQQFVTIIVFLFFYIKCIWSPEIIATAFV